MNIGMYQSAASLSALERWQDSVAQNITSSQVTGFRKRTINFSTQAAGEIQFNPRKTIGHEAGSPMLFPKVNSGINYVSGEAQATRREFDVAIQGDGFFEMQRADGSHAFSRNGEFRLSAERTLITSSGDQVLSNGGSPITLLPDAGNIVINLDGTVYQGETELGKLSIQKFADNSQLMSVDNGYFIPPANMDPETVDSPQLLQGYLEGSNVTPLREMVDLVLIARAYEANQKMINTLDQQMDKALEALG